MTRLPGAFTTCSVGKSMAKAAWGYVCLCLFGNEHIRCQASSKSHPCSMPICNACTTACNPTQAGAIMSESLLQGTDLQKKWQAGQLALSEAKLKLDAVIWESNLTH